MKLFVKLSTLLTTNYKLRSINSVMPVMEIVFVIDLLGVPSIHSTKHTSVCKNAIPFSIKRIYISMCLTCCIFNKMRHKRSLVKLLKLCLCLVSDLKIVNHPMCVLVVSQP